MDDGDHAGGRATLSRICVLLSGIASAVMVLTIYHCIAVSCNRRRLRPQLEVQGEDEQRERTLTRGLDNSIVQLIPAYKYDKEVGLVGEDGICAVCLCEFEVGQEVRTLPECVHSFHVPCIDMWLYSHTSCPLCRTDTTPPRAHTLQPTSDSGGLMILQSSTPSVVRLPPPL
ncbi:Ring-h2 finger protein atl52 [Thalictrum thalictroides]|uniref:RING-type E3 ubiquitin transferase n=1 Tax=Thalictrum thalictroides TaxID=46969 RepID=A0A7J6WND9_THATH|nr:Ring-h2 finger protein atl52 [Thalictrum thalictroides]